MGKKGERRDKHMNIKRMSQQVLNITVLLTLLGKMIRRLQVLVGPYIVKAANNYKDFLSIRPTNTPREAEAEALRMAVRQL